MRYNFRDSLGRFAKQRPLKVARFPQSTSRFPTIVPGRLYDYRGTVVRAGRSCSNGKRHVSFHKQLHGFVEDAELQLIDKSTVQSYLTHATVTK